MMPVSVRLRYIAATILLLLSCLSAVGHDGPYVLRSSTGALEAWSVETKDDGARKHVQALPENARITIPSVGTLPPFEIRLRGPAEIAADEIETRPNAPLFVVADTHGEFEILAQMLLRHRIVDRKLRWSFGRGHLVVLGDIFDRGAHQTEILWLLYALEAQAQKAGGGVHLVVGNHEAMVLGGDLRYLNDKYRETAQVLGASSYAELFGTNSVLGQWLRTKPSMIRINDLLCLHGGVSPQLVEHGYSLAQVNSTLRAVLDGRPFTSRAELDRAEFLAGRSGPWWYRGYFADASHPAEATAADVRRIREHFGVARILVGHTRVPAIAPLYEGEVIAVQVYPERNADGDASFEALMVRDGRLLRAMPDGETQPLKP